MCGRFAGTCARWDTTRSLPTKEDEPTITTPPRDDPEPRARAAGADGGHRGGGRHLPRDVARPPPRDECPGRPAVSARSGRHGLRLRGGTMNPDPIRDADTDPK